MNLPILDRENLNGKQVIVRMDLDVAEDYTRVKSANKTLLHLLENKAKIIIIGHKGRPDGEVDKSLSLAPLVEVIESIVGKNIKFVDEILGEKVEQEVKSLRDAEILLLENLRFDAREKENDEEFAKGLSSLVDFYVNEAFAVSHRAHASIVGLPKFLPHAAGFRFVSEVEHLGRVIENPQRPLVFLISGIKKDKLEMIENIKDLADRILIAGRLPEYIEKEKLNFTDDKLIVAQLNPDKEDITLHSIEKFEGEIGKAKTIVLAGVIGKYEDEGQRQGTRRVFEAVAGSSAYKVAGGGDTEAALTMFNLTDKFDWISVGGGAALEFLAKRTLPGIEALITNSS